MDKRTIFVNYNRIKHSVPDFYLPRLNRAFGVAQKKEPRPYKTTFTSCDCPDAIYRKVICKHIIALWLKETSDINKLKELMLLK